MKGYSADLAYIHEAGFTSIAKAAAKFLLRELRAAGIVDGLVVDVGCGGGALATELCDAGYEVLGFDISASMIRLAKKNEPRATFRVASYRGARFPACVAVVSVGECLSYLFDAAADADSLDRFVVKAHAALRPGGLLLVDVLERMRVAESRSACAQDPKAAWAVLVRVREKKGVVHREITSFRKVGQLYRRTTEVHRQRRYSRKQLLRVLRESGFRARALRGYGAMRFRKGQVGFLARKR